MENEIENIAARVDEIIRQEKWFDFQVLEYDGRQLTIYGGIDLTYYHQLEITFKDVFFVSIFCDGWHTDTSEKVIEVPDADKARELNIKFDIEQGYQIFIIHPEDRKQKIYIAAKSITYNEDKVYYYDRPNLQENERLAGFVKKGK